MVTGNVGRQLYSVSMELFEERAAGIDGAVVVTTAERPTDIVGRLTGGASRFDRDRLAVVDARGTDDGEPEVGHRERVDPADDPETVEKAVTAGLEWLADEGVERRHFLYDDLATGYELPDTEAAYDRAYRIAMTVGAEDGLALFTLDEDRLPPNVVAQLGHLFDVHVELRELEGNAELRWTGLFGASDDWVCFSDADLGVGGFQ